MDKPSEELPATLQNIIDQKSLKWIFVGGKGGVGKTTCSCSLAVQLSQHRSKVLLISTDPAHNVSDAFNQQVARVPTLVKGFDNLYAMEIDPRANVEELELAVGEQEAAQGRQFRQMLSEFISNFPGMDEFMSYTEVFRLVNSMDYEVVVFDTAPTGHTIRLLAFPQMMENSLGKVIQMKNRLAPMVSQLGGFLGIGMEGADFTRAIEDKMPIVKEITRQFKDASQTTFVCVCIPEFLSVYETERLVTELWDQEIDVHNIIINQLLFEDKSAANCSMCKSRRDIQKKYLLQVEDLYSDMHVVRLPLLEQEVRGPDAVKAFSRYLMKPYQESKPAATSNGL